MLDVFTTTQTNKAYSTPKLRLATLLTRQCSFNTMLWFLGKYFLQRAAVAIAAAIGLVLFPQNKTTDEN